MLLQDRRDRSSTPSKRARQLNALRRVLSGLRSGDLGTVLLTIEMASEENRMPCADPAETARILAFLTRLSRLDAALPRHQSTRCSPFA